MNYTQIWLTAAKLTCPCNTLWTMNSFARSDTDVVIDSEPHPSRRCKTSLICSIGCPCSAFRFYTPTNPLHDNVFFFCFFFSSSAYFTEVKWSISKKSIIFSRCQRGSNIFQGGGGGGGVQHFPGGVQLLTPYRNPYNLWFSKGGPDPLSPPWIRTCV